MTLSVGTRLSHYDVTALIGEGGMGQVYQHPAGADPPAGLGARELPQLTTDDAVAGADAERYSGTYQIGDDQARSCRVAGRSGRGSTPARIASQVFHRQVGFSSTRT